MTRRFKFGQMKSLGSKMTQHLGIIIYVRYSNKISYSLNKCIDTYIRQKAIIWDMEIQICTNKIPVG